MQLRVINQADEIRPFGLKESFNRTLGYFICYITGSFLFIIPFLRQDNKGIPDWLGQTKVISEEEYENLLIMQKNSHTRESFQLELFF